MQSVTWKQEIQTGIIASRDVLSTSAGYYLYISGHLEACGVRF